MTVSRIRCGVAGTGSLGQHHARIYASLPGAELAGIFEPDDARAAEICGRHGCRRFATLEEMAERCDAVSVVVPTNHHAAVALPLLAKGVHLLIEKPLCVTMEEAARILDAAAKADRIVQVGHIEHYNPVMSFLEKAVSEPRYITAERLAPFTPRGTEVGVVLDLMIHDIGIVLQLANSPVERIDAVGVSVVTRTEDIANARIAFRNGCVANLSASRVSLKKNREIRVFQTGGYLSIDFMQQKGHTVRVDPAAEGGFAKEDLPIEKGEPLAIELGSFVACVRDRATPKVGGELGRTALEVALRITEQIRAGMARR
ncbi:MAG: Gfo/Idh/MocA family oxidoreductase [Verrucomicrobia bacterium]|nr:Gfo/Idh/MocA family oxidoreductase [Verrucomicrobiota bacterium]